MKKRSAFTLIELLVVIAIIAILAAILFPVFAQAKAAAKKAASLSNTKQLSLGVIMYSNDVDDNLPWGDQWNTGHDQLCYGTGLCFSSWAWDTYPYLKNANILSDPQTSPDGPYTNAPINFETYYTQYGYNYTYLSPDSGTSPGITVSSRSSTYFPNPAGTVMLGAKWAQKENQSGFDYGTTFPGGALAANSVEVPVCDPIPYWCMAGWASDTFFTSSLLLTAAEGGLTGGNSQRVSNQCVTAFLDGHSKTMSPGALAVGSNWTPTITGSQQMITDYTKYLWGAVDSVGH